MPNPRARKSISQITRYAARAARHEANHNTRLLGTPDPSSEYFEGNPNYSPPSTQDNLTDDGEGSEIEEKVDGEGQPTSQPPIQVTANPTPDQLKQMYTPTPLKLTLEEALKGALGQFGDQSGNQVAVGQNKGRPNPDYQRKQT